MFFSSDAKVAKLEKKGPQSSQILIRCASHLYKRVVHRSVGPSCFCKNVEKSVHKCLKVENELVGTSVVAAGDFFA